MSRGSGQDDLVSLNERNFILSAVAENKRIDGRGPYDFRSLKITFGNEPGRVNVRLGQTKYELFYQLCHFTHFCVFSFYLIN